MTTLRSDEGLDFGLRTSDFGLQTSDSGPQSLSAAGPCLMTTPIHCHPELRLRGEGKQRDLGLCGTRKQRRAGKNPGPSTILARALRDPGLLGMTTLKQPVPFPPVPVPFPARPSSVLDLPIPD